MKIIHLAPHADDNGNGVVNVAVDLACAQAALGHDVAFVSPGGSFVELLQRSSVLYHGIPEITIAKSFFAFRRLRNLLPQFEPAVVHAHMVPGALLAAAMRRRGGFRLVTSIHNGPRLRTRLMAVGDAVICVSEALAAAMRRQGMLAHKLRIVRNGPLGSPRRDKPAVPAEEVALAHPAIVTVAGLFAHKGVGDLIEAFTAVAARLPTATLYVVGDGPARARLERTARRHPHPERIVFTGFVRDPRSYLQAADLFVLASHREGFGLVLAEAREAGCAIIATDVGGIREALDGGAAGLLVPPRRPRELAAAMLDLLQDRGRRETLRARAAANLEWLNVRRLAEETLAVYREVLEARRR